MKLKLDYSEFNNRVKACRHSLKLAELAWSSLKLAEFILNVVVVMDLINKLFVQCFGSSGISGGQICTYQT